MEKLTYEQAKEKAFSILSFGSNTEYELSGKLKAKGADEDDIKRILEFCREYNLVCDREWAVKKTKDYVNLKGFGKRRIETELKRHGIGADDIEYAMSVVEIPEDVPENSVRKKLGGDFSKKSIDRTLRYFIGRGYSIYNIKECIERITQNEI